MHLPVTEHWDGRRWKVVPCPSPVDAGKQTRSSLDAVAIDAPDDAWAVGSWSPIEHDSPSYALIEHWNGARWSVVPAPRSGSFSGLTAVAAISPTAAWAIGYGDADGHAVTVFMTWDGTSWRTLPSPAGTGLTGLAAMSARDVWVVGTKGAAKYRTLAEHWDGSTWTIVPTPNAFKGRTRNSALYAVSGSSSSNVWAAGWYQSGAIGIDHAPLTEHWDGARWQVQPNPDGSGSAADTQLFAVNALSRTSAWAVGGSGPGFVLTERWDGLRWTTPPKAKLEPGVSFASLNGVAAANPDYAWVVGSADKGLKHITLIEKWDGSSWQQVPSPSP